jgi:hypothetical protein
MTRTVFFVSEVSCTVDRPQIGHPPDPDKPVALRTCSVIGKELRCKFYGSASVAANTHHFEDLSDLRVSYLRTVTRIIDENSAKDLAWMESPHGKV